jgi:hypothetical protein
VGQESNLHPAVVEVAALRAVTFLFVPALGRFNTLSRLVSHTVLFRSRALLPFLLPQACGNGNMSPEREAEFRVALGCIGEFVKVHRQRAEAHLGF